MKIIFLDIDGVLNSRKYIIEHKDELKDRIHVIDPSKVEMIRKLIDKHDDLRIVISSSWRKRNVQDTVEFLLKHGLESITDAIIGVTPRSICGGRGEEIKWFIDNVNSDKIGDFIREPFEIDDYVIIDDDDFDLLDYQKDTHLLKTTFEDGLDYEDTLIAECMLYGKRKR